MFSEIILRISYYENDKKEMSASGLAEIAKVLQTTPNYLLGFADNNDGFADEALGLLRDVKGPQNTKKTL